MGDAVLHLAARLEEFVELAHARIFIPTYMRMQDGKVVEVHEHWRKVPLVNGGADLSELNPHERQAFEEGGSLETIHGKPTSFPWWSTGGRPIPRTGLFKGKHHRTYALEGVNVVPASR